jgi:oligopeptidase A
VNTFLHPLGEAHFDHYRPEDVLPALDAAEAEAWRALASVPAAGDKALAVFSDATQRLEHVRDVVAHLDAVLGGSWRDVARTAGTKAASVLAAVHQDREVYDVLRASAPADPVWRRLREEVLAEFVRHGVELPPEQRSRLAAINGRLAELAVVFRQNLLAVDAATGLAVETEAELAGLPPGLVAAARAGAAARDLTGYYLPYSEAHAGAVLRMASVAATREKMYALTITRGWPVNEPVVTEILRLRQELADLLGYADFVELRLTDRMLGKPQDFLDELEHLYRPYAEREQRELLEFARSLSDDPRLELTAADLDTPAGGYYTSRLRQQRFGRGAAAVSVPFETARDTMFEALTELYGVRFSAADGVAGWHPSVEVVDLSDVDGRLLARIWCDWFARPDKRSGAWTTAPYVARPGLGPHLGTLNTNFATDSLDIRDMRIMWHEFGHVLHHAFTRTPDRLLSSERVYLDFVEAPSRIMENWPLEPEILRRMGLPDEISASVRDAERFMVATKKVIGLFRPSLDLAVHRSPDEALTLGVALKQRFLPAPVDPDDRSVLGFHHIFAAEYAAGHYAYRWAEVLDADLFSRFAADGVLDRTTGRAYVDTLLARGNEDHPAHLVQDFLGREVTIDAMMARDGLG